MATSAKRKQEETHLKMLREMTSLPANRKCFDCDQRGPTYVNMTVGSFVCTTCSGILRGLNPPHRVKSISMTTFTQQEIEFLQKHSNEVCKHIWLGLYDDRTSVVPDFREPQKVKEFLQEKYEKKRWYVPPDQARVVANVQASVSGSSASSTGSTPEVQPLKTLQLNKTPLRQSPGLARSQAQSAAQEKKFDLLSDLGDIFAAPPTQTATPTNFANFAHFPNQSAAPQGNSNTNFANFDAFGNTAIPSHQSTSPPSKSFSSGTTLPAIFPSILSTCMHPYYSFSLFISHLLCPLGQPAVCRNALWMLEVFNLLLVCVCCGYACTLTVHTCCVCLVASFGTGSMSMPAGFGNASSYCLPTSFSGNFQQQFPGQAPIPYSQPGAYHPQSNGPGYPVYGQNKPSITPFGQPIAVPGMSNNPFVAGAPAGPFPSGGSSTNPFL
uniref:Arf-GAP domain-containing protein n=1 Tax=Astatotilapia calliptera TaxID=8154 RepID=A0AAX7T2I2_ASTCA